MFNTRCCINTKLRLVNVQSWVPYIAIPDLLITVNTSLACDVEVNEIILSISKVAILKPSLPPLVDKLLQEDKHDVLGQVAITDRSVIKAPSGRFNKVWGLIFTIYSLCWS